MFISIFMQKYDKTNFQDKKQKKKQAFSVKRDRGAE